MNIKDDLPIIREGTEVLQAGDALDCSRPQTSPNPFYLSRVGKYRTEIFDYCYKAESECHDHHVFLAEADAVGKGSALVEFLFCNQHIGCDPDSLYGLSIVQFAILSNISWKESSDEQYCGGSGWFQGFYIDSLSLGVPESFYLRELYKLVDMGLIEKREELWRVSPFFNRNIRKYSSRLAYRGLMLAAKDFRLEGLHELPASMMDRCGLTPIEKIALGASFYLNPVKSSNPEKGFIYLVSAKGSGRYKIGLTTGSVKSRIRSFKTGSAFPISLEYSFSASDVAATEKALHQIFDTQRVKGEWFYLSKLDRIKIEALGYREEWKAYWRSEVDRFRKKEKISENWRAI